jgi:hypothetical protein
VKKIAKELLLNNQAGRTVYGKAQELWFDSTYRRRRERYQLLVADDGHAQRGEEHLARAHRKIAARGYSIAPRARGEVHTFAYVPSHWSHQNQIVQGLSRLGPVSRFDYATQGFKLSELRTPIPGSAALRAQVIARMLKEVKEAHARQPLDIFFSYALGWDISAEALREIQGELGVPCVNISLDDKNWWDEIERGDHPSGMKNIAPSYDLNWTSASAVLPWHWAENSQALFLAEGVNVDWFAPDLSVPQDLAVGFVGNNFGYRPDILAALKKAGIDVTIFGVNWPAGPLSDTEMLRFFNRCRINLGLGDMHYSRWLTNLKGRDFEVPAVGRGLYLTTYNADLASSFHVGREIHCYRGVDELIDLLRHALRNPEECAAMAARARAHCIAEHQWQHRYETLLRALGLLKTSAA